MTSLAAALAVDSRGPCGLYIITDSRITWPAPRGTWDSGRKTFATTQNSDIFGFCGDAYFPSVMIGQFTSLIDSNVLDLHGSTASERHRVFLEFLIGAAKTINTPWAQDFSIFHGSREGSLMKSCFKLWKITYHSQTKAWSDDELELTPSTSYLAYVDGSGSEAIEKERARWITSEAAGTSRAAMHTFCKSLHSGADPSSGGPPQLVGIWRKGFGRQFGFCWRGVSYLAGAIVPKVTNYEATTWFNHLFEECDGKTGKKLKTSKSHRASLAPRR